MGSSLYTVGSYFVNLESDSLRLFVDMGISKTFEVMNSQTSLNAKRLMRQKHNI